MHLGFESELRFQRQVPALVDVGINEVNIFSNMHGKRCTFSDIERHLKPAGAKYLLNNQVEATPRGDPRKPGGEPDLRRGRETQLSISAQWNRRRRQQVGRRAAGRYCGCAEESAPRRSQECASPSDADSQTQTVSRSSRQPSPQLAAKSTTAQRGAPLSQTDGSSFSAPFHASVPLP
ncbi:hypothetical protein HPB47_007237 [Ixodes persulcatus]|uniref:Uncharacterized protein n=1 Tax=Ixodes persulcatus TaxID=34615 RepID=A0AC60P8I0_IXOPE|nr:hypothetical protein HPB47_007237 [Ixodes persulcatus]